MNAPPNEKLIYDRTIEDIRNRTAKGYLNFEDVQRLLDWIHYFDRELKLSLTYYQYEFAMDLTKKKFQSIIDNVHKIKVALPQADDEPKTPLAKEWNLEKQNDLERILQIAWDFYSSPSRDKLYSGTFRAGNHIKFRKGKIV